MRSIETILKPRDKDGQNKDRYNEQYTQGHAFSKHGKYSRLLANIKGRKRRYG